MQIAERMSRLGTETSFDVLAEIDELKEKGKNIVSFAIGESDFCTPQNIINAAKKALDNACTHYCPSCGVMDFRKVAAGYISKTRKIDVKPTNIVVTPGGKPIIFFSILACINKGDEVIYPSPGYPIYESMINFVSAKPVPLPLLESKEFSFDVEDLKARITPKTKMLIINSPQNPTGGIVPKKDLEKVAKIAVKNNLWVLSDEIYSRIIYNGKFESIIQFPGMKERTIILEGHSKAYAMTGWRLGYGVMNEKLAFHVGRLMTNSNSCTSTFTQIAGAEAYLGPQTETEKMVKEFKERRDLIVKGLNNIDGISCLKPHGAFYVFPNVTKACKDNGFKDANHLRKYLLHKAGVAVLSRIHFGIKNKDEDQEYSRFSYATSKDVIEEGLKRIKEALANKKQIRDFLNE